MASQELIEHLLALPDATAQKQFLETHTSHLDDQFATALKETADQLRSTDLQRSLQVTDLLFHLAELTGNPLHRALGLLAEANARSIGLGEYQRALELYDEAAEIYQVHDRLVEQANAQIGKLWSLASLSRYDEALETGRWASQVLESHGQWLPLAKLTANLGAIHGRLGEDAEALTLFDRARELYHQLGAEGERFLPRIEHNRAIILRNLGQFEDAIQAGQATWQMLTAMGRRVEAARAQQNLAVTYYVLGRYNDALERLDQVREIFLEGGRQRDAVLTELFISECLLQVRRFAGVLDKSRQIREQFAELGVRLEVAQAMLTEAVAYAGLERYNEALASLAEARRLFEAEGNDVLVASTDLETAAVLYYQNRVEESLEIAQTCTAVFEEHDLPVEKAKALLVAARAALAVNQHDRAHQLVSQALTVGESSDITSLTYQCHHLLGALARVQRDAQTALAEYDRAIQALERLRGRLMVEFRADFLEDKQVVYEDVVSLCLDLNQPHQGLEYAERAKSRALLDLLAYRLDLGIEARDARDRPLVDELMALRAERDRLYRRWEGDEEFAARGRTAPNGGRQQLQQDVLALEKQITGLWHKLLIRNADYARDAALWQVRTEPIQPYLAPDTLLLEYFIVHGEVIAFLVTEKAVEARRLSGDLARVQQLLRLLWLNLKAVPGSTAHRVTALEANVRGILQQLHTLLIAPLGDALDSHPRLIIVPHGLLHYLPFHALHDGQSFLLEQHELSYLPGASLLRYCREAQPAPSGLLAFGHSYDGRLPYTVQEARSIAALLDTQPFLEEAATRTQLQAAASGSRTIHLATHGDFRPDNPLFSGLALADGWLTTLDIFNLQLKASLVTLSACQTGRNVVGGGDELLGLMRAFLYAGAASLVLSLWTVEDRSTAQLMEVFYQKLAAGWTKGAALRYAQLQFTGEDSDVAERYTHPYFWAPFFLVGDAGPL